MSKRGDTAVLVLILSVSLALLAFAVYLSLKG